MKVLCDVHIAKKVVRFFRDNGVESVHVNDILDSWYTKDEDIANYADDYDYTIMSKDADFKNSHLLKSSPKKLLKINLGNIPTKKLIEILGKNLELLKEKFEQEKCLVEINADTIVIIEQ